MKSDNFIGIKKPGQQPIFKTFKTVLSSNKIVKGASFVVSDFSGDIIHNFLGEKILENIPVFDTSKIAKIEPLTIEESAFIEKVKLAIENIKSGEFQKIVLSRVQKIHLLSSFNFAKVFEELCSKYTTAYVNLIVAPEIGIWMGASPELLLKIDSNQLETVSLAGTQTIQEKSNFSNKEADEHEYVTQHIFKTLQQFCGDEIQIDGPFEIQAGNLVHLKTSFKAIIPNYNIAILNLLLKKLHPTPAVGALPMEVFKNSIQKFEIHNREIYSGFLGEVSKSGCELYVNLRTMKILENNAYLFVGAGITQNSIPQNEWKETHNKAQTLKSVLKELKYIN